MRRLLLAALLATQTAVACGAAATETHAVVLLYHHISTSTPASTSVSPEQFEQHLDYLEKHDYVVLPLATLLDAIYAGKMLPDNAVAITFDDAYESVLTEAWPFLKSRKLPFTVYVATAAVDRGYTGYMSWEQMRKLDPALASFGAHSVSHSHLVERRQGESAADRIARNKNEIQVSVDRIASKLETEVRSFTYPYGEYDEELAGLVQAAGLYGLAQQSGAVGPDVSAQQIPRFPLATGYADLERFTTAINTRPLPVIQPAADAWVVSAGDAPETTLLQLEKGPYRRGELTCYSATGHKLPLVAEPDGYRVTLPPLHPGRNKINCTAPSTEKSGEFFWYSRLWIVIDAQGAWLQE